jgi:cytochrome c oxidase cbb3-type subunit 3
MSSRRIECRQSVGTGLHTAWNRLQPAYAASFITDPAFGIAHDHAARRSERSEIHKLVNYLKVLQEANHDEAGALLLRSLHCLRHAHQHRQTLPRRGRRYRICARCHGVEGKGKGCECLTMAVQPRDHRFGRDDGAYVRTCSGDQTGRQAVNKSVLMPNWDGNLNDDDIHALVAYLRELCCKK